MGCLVLFSYLFLQTEETEADLSSGKSCLHPAIRIRFTVYWGTCHLLCLVAPTKTSNPFVFPSTGLQHLPFHNIHIHSPTSTSFLSTQNLAVLSGPQGFSSTAFLCNHHRASSDCAAQLIFYSNPPFDPIPSFLNPWGPLRSPSFLQIRRSPVPILVDSTRLAALLQPDSF